MIVQSGSAIVVGVGPERGLGAVLAMCFAEKGLHVFIVGRSEEKLNHIVLQIQKAGGSATPIIADVTLEQDVIRCFSVLRECGEIIQVAAYNVDSNIPLSFFQTDIKTFTLLWQQNCLGAFLFAKEIMAIMQAQQQGTVFFYRSNSFFKSQTAVYCLCIGKIWVKSTGARIGARIFATGRACGAYGD